MQVVTTENYSSVMFDVDWMRFQHRCGATECTFRCRRCLPLGLDPVLREWRMTALGPDETSLSVGSAHARGRPSNVALRVKEGSDRHYPRAAPNADCWNPRARWPTEPALRRMVLLGRTHAGRPIKRSSKHPNQTACFATLCARHAASATRSLSACAEGCKPIVLRANQRARLSQPAPPGSPIRLHRSLPADALRY